MKRLIVIALVAALLTTGGVFAYTWTTATATIGVNTIESDFAEIEAQTITAPTVFGEFTGTWPVDWLFQITPDANYTGDLVIKVYLVNTGELIRYYQHLNMALEFWDSTNTKVDEQEITQVLNLQNAEVEFYWANATGTGPYYVKLTGGGFRLHHWKGVLPGGSVQPMVWAEVNQR